MQLLDAAGIALATLGTLEQVIGNQKQLTAAYKKLDGDLNENSLVVYSGPLTEDVHLLHKGIAHGFWPHFYHETSEAGCLYLGDADLSVPFIVPDLRERLGSDRWRRVHTIQVPHHGAIKNFSAGVVEPGVQAVISFGTTNSYGHPSAYVIGQLHRLQAVSVLVTERLQTALYSSSRV